MKTKEIIKRLQELDPSGELQVISDGRGICIHSIDREVGYWDGPAIYVDEDLEFYPKKIYICDKKDKIVISSLRIEDFVDHKTDIEKDIIIDCYSPSTHWIDIARKEKEIMTKLRLKQVETFLQEIKKKLSEGWKIFHHSNKPIDHYNSSFYKKMEETKQLCQGETIALLDSGKFQLNTETREWTLKE